MTKTAVPQQTLADKYKVLLAELESLKRASIWLLAVIVDDPTDSEEIKQRLEELARAAGCRSIESAPALLKVWQSPIKSSHTGQVFSSCEGTRSHR
jgi:hypothetical protein